MKGQTGEEEEKAQKREDVKVSVVKQEEEKM